MTGSLPLPPLPPLPLGCAFQPTDDELVSYYLSHKVAGVSQQFYTGIVHDFDVFGQHEPWDIWQIFGPCIFKNSVLGYEDLYFFSKLKKTTPKGKRACRKVGSGTWKGQDTGTLVYSESDENVVTGLKKRFQYKNSNGGGKEEGVSWIMFEYSLASTSQRSDYVLCQIHKKYPSPSDRQTKKKRKLCTDDHLGFDHLELQRLCDQYQQQLPSSPTMQYQCQHQQPLPSSPTLVMESSSSLANPHDQQNIGLSFNHVERQYQCDQYQQQLPSSPTMVVEYSSSLANPHDQQNIGLGFDHVEQQYQCQHQQPLPSSPTLVMESSSSLANPHDQQNIGLSFNHVERQYQCDQYQQQLPSSPTMVVEYSSSLANPHDQQNIGLGFDHVEQQYQCQHQQPLPSSPTLVMESSSSLANPHDQQNIGLSFDHVEQQYQCDQYQQQLPSSPTMVVEYSSSSLANPHDQHNIGLGFDHVEQQYQCQHQQPLPSSPTLVVESSSSTLANPHNQQNIILGVDPDYYINMEEVLLGCDQQQYQEVNGCRDYDHNGGLGHNNTFVDHQPLPSPVHDYEQESTILCVPNDTHHVEEELKQQQQQQHCDWTFHLDYDAGGEQDLHNQPLLQSISLLDLAEIF